MSEPIFPCYVPFECSSDMVLHGSDMVLHWSDMVMHWSDMVLVPDMVLRGSYSHGFPSQTN